MASSKRKRETALYATLTRRLLVEPPIRHRHTDDKHHLLLPFEFALAAGCTAMARIALRHQRHQQSMQKGREAIDQAKQLNKELEQQRQQIRRARIRGHPIRRDAYVGLKNVDYKQTAAEAYQHSTQELRKQLPPTNIMVIASRYKILRRSGISGTSMRRLKDALDRLLQPIGPDDDQFPPVLLNCKPLQSGRLKLQVNSFWLREPFGRVPLPIPISSATACALYLFLHTIKTHAAGAKAKSLVGLCKLLGIPTRYGFAHAVRALDCAIAVINRHLNQLPGKALDRQGVKVPGRYRMELIEDGRLVRFLAQQREWDEDEAETTVNWTTKKKRAEIKRVEKKRVEVKRMEEPLVPRSLWEMDQLHLKPYLNGKRLSVFGWPADEDGVTFRLPDGMGYAHSLEELPEGVEWRKA
jgi:hypothetical protein